MVEKKIWLGDSMSRKGLFVTPRSHENQETDHLLSLWTSSYSVRREWCEESNPNNICRGMYAYTDLCSPKLRLKMCLGLPKTLHRKQNKVFACERRSSLTQCSFWGTMFSFCLLFKPFLLHRAILILGLMAICLVGSIFLSRILNGNKENKLNYPSSVMFNILFKTTLIIFTWKNIRQCRDLNK